jgi:site-specific DNA-methyltransferase (adenine-specific)
MACPIRINKFINRIIIGDAVKVLKQLPAHSIDCVVTSPPYWSLRDYKVKGQLGLERTLPEYLAKLYAVFDEVHRVLKPTGTCFVNLGDTYFSKSGARKPFANRPGQAAKYQMGDRAFRGGMYKSLCQVPSRFALEMTNRGWLLRNEIIWHKPNCMPSSARDRFAVDFEKLFFFVKERRYYFEQQFEPLRNKERLLRRFGNPARQKKRKYGVKYISAINPETIAASSQRMLDRGRIKRCVWLIPPRPFSGNHFAVYPPALIETPIKAGCPKGGIVLDPFIGSGTTALVARQLGRKFIGIDLNPEYVQMAERRLAAAA